MSTGMVEPSEHLRHTLTSHMVNDADRPRRFRLCCFSPQVNGGIDDSVTNEHPVLKFRTAFGWLFNPDRKDNHWGKRKLKRDE
jgi:hypothetical protein